MFTAANMWLPVLAFIVLLVCKVAPALIAAWLMIDDPIVSEPQPMKPASHLLAFGSIDVAVSLNSHTPWKQPLPWIPVGIAFLTERKEKAAGSTEYRAVHLQSQAEQGAGCVRGSLQSIHE